MTQSSAPPVRRSRGLRISSLVLLCCGVALYLLALAGAALFALPALDTARGGAGYASDFRGILSFLGMLFSPGVFVLCAIGAVLGFVARAWVVASLNAALCVASVGIFIWALV